MDRRVDYQAIQDAMNLTTLIRWGARHGGTFSMGCKERVDDHSKGGVSRLWRVIVIRGLDSEADFGIVFNGTNRDISKVVARAATAVRQTPEWKQGVKEEDERLRDLRDKKALQKEEMIEYDYDIWASKRGDSVRG